MTTFQGITFAAIPDRNAPAPRSAYADGEVRPAWTRQPVSVSCRICFNNGGSWFQQEFVFPNAVEAEAFKAWCERNTDAACWHSSGPLGTRSAASAVGFVTRMNAVRA